MSKNDKKTKESEAYQAGLSAVEEIELQQMMEEIQEEVDKEQKEAEESESKDEETKGEGEKPKLVVTRVDDPNRLPLKVDMARQSSSYHISPVWPELETLEKPFNYILQSDGLWEIRNVQAGWLVRRREKFNKKLPGFVEETRDNYGIPRYGKVPADLYWQIVAFFRDICNDSGDEVYVQTFWDPDNQRYFNHVPKQIVSGASVRYERDQALEERCPLVVETHSHNKMSAFFSATDNADEKSDRFFGVMGKLNTHNIEVLYSFLCGGERTNIPAGDIFDLKLPDTFPEGWKGQVTRGSAVPRTTWTPYGLGRSHQPSSTTTRSYGPSKTYSQRNLWQPASKKKEAKEQVEKAAKRAEAEVSEEWDVDNFLSQGSEDEGLTHRPFFRASLRKSLIAKGKVKETVMDLMLEFSDPDRRGQMDEEEKEQLFLGLVEILEAEDVAILSSVMAHHGYGEFMLEALDEASNADFEEAEEGEEGEEEEESSETE